MPIAVLGLLSQGYLNINIWTTAYRIKQNNKTIDGMKLCIFTLKYVFFFSLPWGYNATEEKYTQACYFSQKQNRAEGTKQTVG